MLAEPSCEHAASHWESDGEVASEVRACVRRSDCVDPGRSAIGASVTPVESRPARSWMGLGVSKTGVPDFVRNCGYGRLTITHLDSLWHIGRCPKALIANNFGASSPGYEPGGREFESLRARQL